MGMLDQQNKHSANSAMVLAAIMIAAFGVTVAIAHQFGVEGLVKHAVHPESDISSKVSALQATGEQQIRSAKTSADLEVASQTLRQAVDLAGTLSVGNRDSSMRFMMSLSTPRFNADSLFWTIETTLPSKYEALGAAERARAAYQMAANLGYSWNKANPFHEGWDTVDVGIGDYRLVKLLEDYSTLATKTGDQTLAQRLRVLADATSKAEEQYRTVTAYILQHCWQRDGNKVASGQDSEAQLNDALRKFTDEQRTCRQAANDSHPTGTESGIIRWILLTTDVHMTRTATLLMVHGYFDNALTVLRESGLSPDDQARALEDFASHCRQRHIDDQAAAAEAMAKKIVSGQTHNNGTRAE